MAESVNTNTLRSGVIVGTVIGMTVFSITLLVLVPISISVIVALYMRKLKKVKDRRRAVVITQYGIHGMLEVTEMLGTNEVAIKTCIAIKIMIHACIRLTLCMSFGTQI